MPEAPHWRTFYTWSMHKYPTTTECIFTPLPINKLRVAIPKFTTEAQTHESLNRLVEASSPAYRCHCHGVQSAPQWQINTTPLHLHTSVNNKSSDYPQITSSCPASFPMAPKKKGNKKAADDWEDELGESIASPATENGTTKEVPADEEPAFGGGLMAQLQKKGKKGKKNKQQEDFVEGEDPPTEQMDDFASKAPVEANLEEDDVWSAPVKKNQPAKKEKAEPEEEPEELDASGRVKTKKEKEKEKKEREKQRKKEQVCRWRHLNTCIH